MNKRRPSSPSPLQKRISLGFLVLLLCIAAMFVGYRIGFHDAEKKLSSEREKTEQLLRQIREVAAIDENASTAVTSKEARQAGEIERLRQKLQTLLEKEGKRDALMSQHEYAPRDKKALPPPPYKRPARAPGEEVKLTIIIDDVSYAHDVEMVRSTGLGLVMSFLPPSPRHPGTAELARTERGYMVHLPLEAAGFNDEEPNTLRTGSSEEEIARRIVELKSLYPRVRYMNNHTGSTFTADEPSMERLIRVLKREGITFIDSRTTPETKAPAVSEKYGLVYRGRDVFLDHQDGVENVKRQIAEAVEKAKKHGTAIAIGHPRPDTIQALIESKELLSEVKLVGIDEI